MARHIFSMQPFSPMTRLQLRKEQNRIFFPTTRFLKKSLSTSGRHSCGSRASRPGFGESRVPGENRDPVFEMVPDFRRDDAWTPAPAPDSIRGSPE